MKIRKALAVVLSLAMTVTLMPATAFASTYSVGNVNTVDDGETVATTLRITTEDMWTSGTTENISVNIKENGNFQKFAAGGGAEDDTITGKIEAGVDVTNRTFGLTAVDKDGNNITAKFQVSVTNSDDNYADLAIKYTGTNDASLAKGATLYLLMHIEADGSEGEDITVTIDGSDVITDQKSGITVATISGDATTATVTGTVETSGRNTEVEGADVTIKEVGNNTITKSIEADDNAQPPVVESLSKQCFKLTLPKGITWSDKTTITGSMIKTTNNSYDVHKDIDGRYMYVTFTSNFKNSSKDKLIIKPVYNITKDASEGSITLQIEGKKITEGDVVTYNGDVDDADDLEIGIYGDVDVTIVSTTAEKEIVAGTVKNTDDKTNWVAITFDEGSKGALTPGKYIDLTFNTDDVQVSAEEGIRYIVNDKYASKKWGDATANSAENNKAVVTDIEPSVNNYGEDANTTKAAKIKANKEEDRSSFTITIPDPDENNKWSKSDSNALTLFIPITVAADYTGDITLTAKGNAGIDETTVTVGKAVAPLTVTTTVTNVVNGAKNQAVADITITENKAGVLRDDNDANVLALSLDTLGIANGFAFDNASVSVTEGDLEIATKVEYAKEGDAQITIKDSSSKPSTIKVTGMTVTLSRILAEGEYDLQVGGSALVDNGLYNDDDFSDYVTAPAYINITTAADTAQTGIVANFYLDGSKNSTYTVNSVDATMDAAAYLDSNNRTMVPIRYVAYALGLADTDISYNVGDSTATLSGLTNVVKVTTGSNVLQASNGNVVMDTVAVNNSGRLYVPARFIAQAMGAQVAWDQATKTVTITK